MHSPSFESALDHFRSGRLRQAETELRDVIAGGGEHLEARTLLGIVCSQSGRWSEAADLLSSAIEVQPRREDVLFWLAHAKRNTGQLDEAIALCKRSLELNPRNPVVLNEYALCCMASDTPAACEALKAAVSLDPSSAAYHHHLGRAFHRLSLLSAARAALEQALRLDPELSPAAIDLAAILEVLGANAEAVSMLEQVVARFPGDSHLLSLLASAYANSGDPQRAEQLYRRAMASEPRSGTAFGFWLQQWGRFEESVRCFEIALEAEPVQGAAYFGLADIKVFRVGQEPLVEKAARVLGALESNIEELSYLRYALAMGYEHEERYEEAMRFYDLANAAAYQFFLAGRPYDRAARASEVDAEIARYTAAAMAGEHVGSSPSEQPIFIVGMIRSGTTLLDHFLTRHPHVESAGEPLIWMYASELVSRLRGADMSKEQTADLAFRCLTVLQQEAGPSPRIIDKQPLNYARLGLIHTVFPRAKIVHLRRNPLDTCLSIYTTFFGQGPHFAYNQGNIVSNYLEYMRLMDHWRKVLPAEVFLEVDYERLVSHQEAMLQEIVEFCGLPWDEACLTDTANASPIRTPSAWKARQPVYGSSVERWRRFEPWLGELASLLP